MRTELKQSILEILSAALSAVSPETAVRRVIERDGDDLVVGGDTEAPKRITLSHSKNIYVVGAGKASAVMAAAMQNFCGNSVRSGIVAVKTGFTTDHSLGTIKLIEAGHPEPNHNSFRAGAATLEILRRANENDVVFGLISGGGSALLEHPATNIPPADYILMNRLLIGSGASIHQINTIRKHCSGLKGGQAAKAAFPATVFNVMLSDVVGDDPSVIASGPFSPDRSTYSDALTIADRFELTQRLPKRIIDHLRSGTRGEVPETPYDECRCFQGVHHYICGSNRLALDAAALEASRLGYRTILFPKPLDGNVSNAAAQFVAEVKQYLSRHGKWCVLAGGETTVSLGRKHGKGGRNQEFALTAAFELKGFADKQIGMACLGTDGNDGPTDAAGAFVDASTLARARRLGFDPRRHLERHDAYPLFEGIGDLVKTGPTCTNVMDIQIALVHERRI